MVMHLSPSNILLLWWLWRMPWASAQDLALVLGATADPTCQMTVNAINRMMARHTEWVARYKVNRKGRLMFRYVVLPAGVVALENAFGWQPQWWHTSAGQQLLFKRLPFLELCYKVLPSMLRTDQSWMNVSPEVPGICPVEGNKIMTVDTTQAVLKDLHWYQESAVRLVATYGVGDAPFDIFLPVVYYSSYRRPSDVESWEEEVGQVLRGDVWESLPNDPGVEFLIERGSLPFPMLVVAPNELVGVHARATEPWQGSFNVGIMDLDQNVVSTFSGFALRWTHAVAGSRPSSLGDHHDLERLVTESYWSALFGPLEWDLLCWVHDYQGSTLKQAMAYCGIGERRAGKMLKTFTDQDLAMVDGDRMYMARAGYIVYAEAEGCHVNRVRGRQAYLLTNSQRRQEHSEHGWETAEMAVVAKADGVTSFSGIHVTWDYPEYGTQIKGDIYLKVRVSPFASRRNYPWRDLPDDLIDRFAKDATLAILLSVEVERRAGYVVPVTQKLNPYRILRENDVDIPMALITRSEDVVHNFLREAIDLPVVATTWDQLRLRGFAQCWGAGRYLDRFPPTDPRNHDYEQYVDFLNPIGFYAEECNSRDWELFLDWKYGAPLNPQADEEDSPMQPF